VSGVDATLNVIVVGSGPAGYTAVTYAARAVILATGSAYRRLGVPGPGSTTPIPVQLRATR
jgi:thioredoxin reductase